MPKSQSRFVLRVLGGEAGLASDIVCLNAGATIYVADLAPDIATGIAMAKAAIANGIARSTLDQFIAATQLKS